MSEVETKLTQLREAADQMNRSCLRIDDSIANVEAVVQSLMLDGWQSENGASFALRYSYVQGEIDMWSITMRKLAIDLNRAADDIESAIQSTTGVTTDITFSYHSGGGRGRRHNRIRVPEVPAPPLPYSVDDYVSPVNRPLYDKLMADRTDLT